MKRDSAAGDYTASAESGKQRRLLTVQGKKAPPQAPQDERRISIPQKPGSRFRWYALALLAVAVAGALAYRQKLEADSARALRSGIPTAAARAGTIEQTIRLSGITAAKDSVLLRAPYLRGRRSLGGARDFSLTLDELAPSGKHVDRNTLVASFDNVQIMNRLDDFRAERIASEADVKTVRAQQELLREAHRLELLRAKARVDKAALDLKTTPVRSAIQVALMRLELEEAQAAYKALQDKTKYLDEIVRAEVRIAQLAMGEEASEERRAQANAEKMQVRAPVAGLMVVGETFRGTDLSQIQAGDELRPGQPYAQIVDARSLIVEASVNQTDVEQLRIGDRAVVKFEAFPDLRLPARVYAISPLASGTGWSSNYVSKVPVFLEIDQVDARLIPNLTVSVDVVLETERGNIVPRESVHFDGRDGEAIAYVLTPSGWEKRELELGLANHVEVAVQSGIQPGEQVALIEP